MNKLLEYFKSDDCCYTENGIKKLLLYCIESIIFDKINLIGKFDVYLTFNESRSGGGGDEKRIKQFVKDYIIEAQYSDSLANSVIKNIHIEFGVSISFNEFETFCKTFHKEIDIIQQELKKNWMLTNKIEIIGGGIINESEINGKNNSSKNSEEVEFKEHKEYKFDKFVKDNQQNHQLYHKPGYHISYSTAKVIQRTKTNINEIKNELLLYSFDSNMLAEITKFWNCYEKFTIGHSYKSRFLNLHIYYIIKLVYERMTGKILGLDKIFMWFYKKYDDTHEATDFYTKNGLINDGIYQNFTMFFGHGGQGGGQGGGDNEDVLYIYKNYKERHERVRFVKIKIKDNVLLIDNFGKSIDKNIIQSQMVGESCGYGNGGNDRNDKNKDIIVNTNMNINTCSTCFLKICKDYKINHVLINKEKISKLTKKIIITNILEIYY